MKQGAPPATLRATLLSPEDALAATSSPAATKTGGGRNLPPPLQGLHEILTGTKKHEIFQQYRVRWLILAVMCLVAFNHAMFWMTFAGLSNATVEYYRLCDANLTADAQRGCGLVAARTAVLLLQLWAPMVAIVSLPLAALVAKTSGSTRRLLLVAASVSLTSAVLRVLPGTPFISSGMPGTVYFVQVSQAVNGLVGPLVWATPSFISCKWFARTERATATAALTGAHFLGAAVSLLVPSATGQRVDIETLMWVQFGLSLAAFLTVFCTPAAPPTPPSGTAHVDSVAVPQRALAQCSHFSGGLMQFGSSSAPMALSLTGGLCFGLMYGWLAGLGGLFKLGGETSGMLGTVAAACAALGSVAVGPIVDHALLPRRLMKTFMVSAGVVFTILLAFIAVALPVGDQAFVDVPSTVVAAAVAVTGCAFGTCVPVLRETVVELVYPLPPVVGGLCITACNSLGFLVVASAAFLLPSNAGFVVSLLGVVGGLVFVVACLCCKLQYLRLHQDNLLVATV